MESYRVNEQEWSAIQFPIWPVKFVVFAGLLLLALQYVLDALKILAGDDPDAEDPPAKTGRDELTEGKTWTS